MQSRSVATGVITALTALVSLSTVPSALAHLISPNPERPVPNAGPPPNDLGVLPAPDPLAQQVPPAPLQNNAQPPLRAVPWARCAIGSDPLAGVQGRVTAADVDSPGASDGWSCNLRVIGTQDDYGGGFRTWRYADQAGNHCAFYDTSLDGAAAVLRLGAGPSAGVAVLDMSDPRHPVRTALLQAPGMLSPHESLNLNRRRGLLVAETGNASTLPALISIYDVGSDCRAPVELYSGPGARTGHESGFSRDGKTYWIAGGSGLAAIDITDPTSPAMLWSGNLFAHGVGVSADGNRVYDADPINGQLAILDVSEIQARDPNPEVTEVSRLTWDTVTIPQNALPMQIRGTEYLLEFDEFAFRFSTIAPPNQVGAARIIDLSDETHPKVISNIRLQVNQPGPRAAAQGDPEPPLPAGQFGYSAHYCAIPRPVNPRIAACSFINSGLRVFNIENPRRPREVAYYVAPPGAPSGQSAAANFALSQPAFDARTRQVWYTDANRGFIALELTNGVWPNNHEGATTCKNALRGTPGADKLRGTGFADGIRAGAGDDRVRGRRGNDCVYGQAGTDSLLGGPGSDRLRGSLAADSLLGGKGRDRISGNAGRDLVAGGPGRDALRGGMQPDQISGGAGSDKVNTRGGGRDLIQCGQGNDRVVLGFRDSAAEDCESVHFPRR